MFKVIAINNACEKLQVKIICQNEDGNLVERGKKNTAFVTFDIVFSLLYAVFKRWRHGVLGG